MTSERQVLRWIAVAIPVYFASLWMVSSTGLGVYRYLGALLIMALGFGAGLRIVGGSRRPPAADRLASRKAPSADQIIEAYAAAPEVPQRQRARFLGALAHELRNPLNSVTGFSDMLMGGVDGDLNREQMRSVRTIRNSAERLLRLIGTVVDQAKLETETLRLQQQWVDPSELVSDAIRFVQTRAEDTRVAGGVADGLPRVFVDRRRTIQALASLAVLVIRSTQTDMTMRVAPPRRDQVGRGFVQFDLTTHLKDASKDTLAIVERLESAYPSADALGLEVSVARRIIEVQGGRIWTEAGTAGSLRICMTLPTSAT